MSEIKLQYVEVTDWPKLILDTHLKGAGVAVPVFLFFLGLTILEGDVTTYAVTDYLLAFCTAYLLSTFLLVILPFSNLPTKKVYVNTEAIE